MKELVYKICYILVKFFYPVLTVTGTENLPDSACIVVGNHAQIHGPIANMIYYPRNKRVWCIGEMKHFKEIPAYAYRDFWSEKPKYIRWFFKIASYAIVPLAVCIFNHYELIGVYKDTRIIDTFRQSRLALEEGNDVILFPEQPVAHNNIVYEFQEGYIEVARMYCKKNDADIYFVPQYVTPKLKLMCLGKPVKYDKTAPPKEERSRINKYLMEEITRMAESLPEHTVIPYPNIPKKDYPKNR